MFWLPTTKLEWTLLATAVVVTIAWMVLRGEQFPSDEDIWAMRLPPGEMLVIVGMWLLYGVCRVQLRNRRGGG